MKGDAKVRMAQIQRIIRGKWTLVWDGVVTERDLPGFPKPKKKK